MSTQHSDADVSEMDRDELEDQVKELRQELDRVDNMVVGLYQGRIPTQEERLGDLEEGVEDHEKRISRLESMVEMLESEVSGGGLFDGDG